MPPLEIADWTYQPLERIVVCMDMAASSNLIEELTRIGKPDQYLALFSEVAQYFHDDVGKVCDGLEDQFRRDPHSVCYNFVGDGWILLFPPETEGERLRSFLNLLCPRFQRRLACALESIPTKPTEAMGLRFGIDCGELLRSRVFGHHEYIGRPINIASRLQKLVKELDSSRADQVLVSIHCYERYFRGLNLQFPIHETVSLINIRGAENFPCVRFQLGRARSAKTG